MLTGTKVQNQNHLFIFGDPEQVAQVFQRAEAIDSQGRMSQFTFNAFVPMNRAAILEEKKSSKSRAWVTGARTWEEWCLHNWAVDHWGIQEECVSVDARPSKGYVFLLTEWGVPSRGIAAISREFPRLTFLHYWLKDTMDSAGFEEFKAGELRRHSSSAYADWKKKEPANLIHLLNMAFNREAYLCYLQESTSEAAKYYRTIALQF